MSSQYIIYKPNTFGVAIIIPNPDTVSEHGIEWIAQKDVPVGKPYKIVDSTLIPQDRLFRNAWDIDSTVINSDIKVDLPKAKEIAHTRRRDARNRELLPLDRLATIPSKSAEAEASRVLIRKKYDDMQVAIDNATTPEQIKQELTSIL